MKLYIAGPMTGRDAYNHRAFMAAAERLRNMGHEPVTPFQANSEVWRRHHDRDFDPYADTCDYGGPLLREMFAADVALLLSADGIALLDGWRDSKGAQMELRLAEMFGLDVMDEYGDPVAESVLQEAQRLVHGNRQADYGHPADDFAKTAAMWTGLFRDKLTEPFTAADVPQAMICVKLSREQNRAKRDNATDIAGYAETLHMVRERERDGPAP